MQGEAASSRQLRVVHFPVLPVCCMVALKAAQHSPVLSARGCCSCSPAGLKGRRTATASAVYAAGAAPAGGPQPARSAHSKSTLMSASRQATSYNVFNAHMFNLASVYFSSCNDLDDLAE